MADVLGAAARTEAEVRALHHRVDRGDGERPGANDRGVIAEPADDARAGAALERRPDRVDQRELTDAGRRSARGRGRRATPRPSPDPPAGSGCGTVASCPRRGRGRRGRCRAAPGTSRSRAPPPPRLRTRPSPPWELDDPHVRRLRALAGLTQLVLDLRTFGERPEAIARNAREVDEGVLPSVVRGDEPEALLVAE